MPQRPGDSSRVKSGPGYRVFFKGLGRYGFSGLLQFRGFMGVYIVCRVKTVVSRVERVY